MTGDWPELLTMAETAELARCSRSTVKRAIAAGQLAWRPAWPGSQQKRVRLADACRWAGLCGPPGPVTPAVSHD